MLNRINGQQGDSVEPITVYEYMSWKVEIHYDEGAENPRCEDNPFYGSDNSIVSATSDTEYVDDRAAEKFDDLIAHSPILSSDWNGVENDYLASIVAAKAWGIFMLPLFVNDDGLSVGKANHKWGTGEYGFIFIPNGKLKTYKSRVTAEMDIIADVQTFNCFMRGEVFGYILYDPESSSEEADFDYIDSCWGFYGLKFAELSAIEAMAESVASEATPDLVLKPSPL